MRRGLLISICALGACGAPRELVPPDEPASPAADARAAQAAAPARALAPFEGWAALPAPEFETALAAWNPAAEPGSLSGSDLTRLRAALAEDDETAVRAALLLGASRDPYAMSALLARLEQRVAHPGGLAPGDAVAAAFLAHASGGDTAARLLSLARGARPHPSLPVRVECAASALALGRREGQSFLLEVLREGTPAQRRNPPWTRGATPPELLELAQLRAAEVLSARAGVACAWRPEKSAAQRAEDAAALAERLASVARAGG